MQTAAQTRSPSRRSSTLPSIGRRDLPSDTPSPPSRRKEKYARAALGYSNFVNKSVGSFAAGGQVLGAVAGGTIAGIQIGWAASGGAHIYSSRDKEERSELFSETVMNVSAASGAAVGGFILAGGFVASCATGAWPAGYFGKKYLDKHGLGRPAWSYKPGDKTRVEPGNPCPSSEPRMPIVHSRI